MSGIGAGEHRSDARPASAFAGLGALRAADINSVRAFWRSVERYPAGGNVCAGRSAVGKRVIIVSGWACETRILPDGRRQIFSFLLPGDAIDLARELDLGCRALVALTRLETVDAGVLMGADGGEAVSKAIQVAIQQREDRLFDHMVRIGRLTAKERVLNLLLELYDRLDAVGLVKEGAFRIPLTQEVFADALGLSIVHINRTLQQLRREGLLTLKSGTVTLHHRDRLSAFACYQTPGSGNGPLLDELVA